MTRDLRRPPARLVPSGGLGRHHPGDPGRADLLAGRSAQPADLPADGRPAGRGVRRHRVRERGGRAGLGLRGAGDHPGRGRTDHPVARLPALDADRPLPGHHRRRRLGDGDGRRRALPARPAVGARLAAGSGHLADRRGGGLLGTAGGPDQEAALGRARGRVGSQRRPHGRPGHADLQRGDGRARHPVHRRHRRLRARRRRRLRPARRLRRRLADAAGRPAGIRSVPDRRDDAGPPRVRRCRVRARLRVRRGVRRRARARQLRAPAPRCDAVVRRGRRLAGDRSGCS